MKQGAVEESRTEPNTVELLRYLLVVLLFAQIPVVLLHAASVFIFKELQSGDGAGAFFV